MSKKALKKVRKAFKKQVVDSHSDFGDDTLIIEREALVDVATFMRDEPELSFEMLIDVTAVDFLDQNEGYRFEVVYHFLSLTHKHRLRIKCRVTDEDPSVDSLHEVYVAADWGERETHEMYGIQFNGHPDLRPLLLYVEFEGYPLRKDYDLHGSQPRIDLIDVERPTTNMYNPNFGEYSEAKGNR